MVFLMYTPPGGRGMTYDGARDTNGLPHGAGTMYYPGRDANGNRLTYYDGHWENGLKHGYGVFYTRTEQDKPAFSGVWMEDYANEEECEHKYTEFMVVGGRDGMTVCRICAKLFNDKTAIVPGLNTCLIRTQVREPRKN